VSLSAYYLTADLIMAASGTIALALSAILVSRWLKRRRKDRERAAGLARRLREREDREREDFDAWERELDAEVTEP
jgi:hypothetical protein